MFVPQSYRQNNDEAGPSNEIRGYAMLARTTIYARQTVVLVRCDLPNELFFIWFLVPIMGPFYLGRNWRCMFFCTSRLANIGVRKFKEKRLVLCGGENRQCLTSCKYRRLYTWHETRSTAWSLTLNILRRTENGA